MPKRRFDGSCSTSEFVACYRPENRHSRTATWSLGTPDGRWRAYGYDELLGRDKVGPDIFWVRDESPEDSATLADPDLPVEPDPDASWHGWREASNQDPEAAPLPARWGPL